MVDRLAALLERFPVSAQLFNAGALCGINLLDTDGVHGQLHLMVRRGPLEVSHGGAPVRIEEPSLLLYPRPLSHRFSSDPERGADMACANLRFEGGAGNPVAAALPAFVCMPLAALEGSGPVLDLLFEEAFERRCGRQAMIDRLFEVVMIQVLRQLMERGEVTGGLLAGLSHPRVRHALVAMHEAPTRDWTLEDLGRGLRHVAQRVRRQLPRGGRQYPGQYLLGWRVGLGPAGAAPWTAAEGGRQRGRLWQRGGAVARVQGPLRTVAAGMEAAVRGRGGVSGLRPRPSAKACA